MSGNNVWTIWHEGNEYITISAYQEMKARADKLESEVFAFKLNRDEMFAAEKLIEDERVEQLQKRISKLRAALQSIAGVQTAEEGQVLNDAEALDQIEFIARNALKADSEGVE